MTQEKSENKKKENNFVFIYKIIQKLKKHTFVEIYCIGFLVQI